MTTSTLPADAPRSLVGKAMASVTAVSWDRPSARWLPIVVAWLLANIVTIAAFTAISFGAFQANDIAGWIVTGVCLLLFDWKIRDAGRGNR